MTKTKSPRRRRAKIDTARMQAARASAAHLADLRRAHGRPPPDVSLPEQTGRKARVSRPGRLLVYVPGPTLRGARRMSAKVIAIAASLPEEPCRQGAGAARRDARTARPGPRGGRSAHPRRRARPPYPRPVRRDAGEPGAGAARSQAQRRPLADRRVAAPHPSAGAARLSARRRPRPDRRDRLRASSRPAAGRGGAARPRQDAQGAGSRRAGRLADRPAHRHRRRRRARMPRLRSRTRDPVARRRRRHRPAQGRARPPGRTDGGHAAGRS